MTVTGAQAQTAHEDVDPGTWSDVIALERDAGQRLFGYAVHMGVDRARAADLVQEALVRLWREQAKGVVIQSVEGWTFRTLARMVVDEHRLHRRIARLVSRIGDRMAPAVTEIDATDRLAVWTQVDQLPLRQRQAVYLRYRADLSFDEVAEIMEITPAAARSHASQALATLRSQLVGGDDR